MKADRVVLDTNVLVSAYVFGGKPAVLVRAGITGEMELVTSPVLLAELARVLADKMGFDDDHVARVVRQVARFAAVARPDHRIELLRDEPDNRVLECAQAGGAAWIVTGDRHLLGVGEHEGVRIVSVAEAADRLL